VELDATFGVGLQDFPDLYVGVIDLAACHLYWAITFNHLWGQEFGEVLVESVTEHGVCDDADLFKVR
jgi:hypothetical protein